MFGGGCARAGAERVECYAPPRVRSTAECRTDPARKVPSATGDGTCGRALRGAAATRTLARVKHLRHATAEQLRALTVERAGETRIGQRAGVLGKAGTAPAGARVALLGVPEDIGVRANHGRPGTRRMWRAALPRLLNMQSNAFLDGRVIAIAGSVEVRDLRKVARSIDATKGGPRAREQALRDLRELVSAIDLRVTHVVAALRGAGMVPIVIGGGHNNAYGVLAGCAQALGAPLGCVNVDLHADLRPREGRHSGNAFSYAKADGHLGRYAIVGLSEAYATQAITEAIDEEEDYSAFTLESLLRGRTTIARMAEAAAAHVGGGPATLELDIDAVAQAPASAAAASGFSAAEFRALACQLCGAMQVHAAHIAEGAPGLGPWPDEMVGKLVAELARDIAAGVAHTG